MKEGKEKRNKNLQKNSKISSIDIEKGKNKKNIFLHTPPSPVLRKNYKKDTEVKLVLPSNILLKTPQAPKFQFPRPEIPDYIHRQSLHSDTWKCDYCKFWGDVWFIVKHWCKGIEIGKIHLVELDPRIKKTELEIKVAEELRLKEIKAREWTCP